MGWTGCKENQPPPLSYQIRTRVDHHQPYPNVKEAGTIEGFYPSQRAALLLSAGSPDYNPVPRMSYP